MKYWEFNLFHVSYTDTLLDTSSNHQYVAMKYPKVCYGDVSKLSKNPIQLYETQYV